MSAQILSAFLLFAVASLFTPGPNNLMLMTSGVNYGFAATVPHALGVALGFGFLVLIVGLGLGAVFEAFPRFMPSSGWLVRSTSSTWL